MHTTYYKQIYKVLWQDQGKKKKKGLVANVMNHCGRYKVGLQMSDEKSLTLWQCHEHCGF